MGRRHSLIDAVSHNAVVAANHPSSFGDRKRSVLSVFVDRARHIIAWWIIVQYLVSFHSAIILAGTAGERREL